MKAEERAHLRTVANKEAAHSRRVSALAGDLRNAPGPLTLVYRERVELAEYLLGLGYRRPLTKED